eukprot:12932343-Prorocentrum_lima.AAC.1
MVPRQLRRGVENERYELDRSRSSSPSLRAGHLGPEHLMMEEEMEAGRNTSTQGYEPNNPELERVHAQ